ncbi:hypothetical protein [Burkholderia sp. MSMB617WGS]|uniref:hypothetical protein n=1 Tax=Burkholderia sp. MSMB617WGS TaxID=1637831 RepID=UPI000A465EAD|nr:hypothetical protein [Burkholderia sp. MSMB617WGS]
MAGIEVENRIDGKPSITPCRRRALTNVAGAGPSRFPFASTPVDKETRKRFTGMRFAALSRSVRARTA